MAGVARDARGWRTPVTSVRKLVGGVAGVALTAATLGFVSTAQAPDAQAGPTKCGRNNDSVRKLLECVTLEGTLKHEQALQDIADANGGNRASGSAGFADSADYVR